MTPATTTALLKIRDLLSSLKLDVPPAPEPSRLHVVTVAWREGDAFKDATVSVRMPTDRNDAEFAANVLAKVARLVPAADPDESWVRLAADSLVSAPCNTWTHPSLNGSYVDRHVATEALCERYGLHLGVGVVRAIVNAMPVPERISPAPDELARCRRALVRSVASHLYTSDQNFWTHRDLMQTYVNKFEAISWVCAKVSYPITPAEVEAILGEGGAAT